MILETARLRLRELRAADLDFVAEMLADPEVMRYYPKLYAREEALLWLERQRGRYVRDGHALWLVHRPYWRRGYAAEAARGVRDHAFGAYGYPRVVSLIRPENAPSQAVARTLGMQPTGRTLHGGFVSDVWSVDR